MPYCFDSSQIGDAVKVLGVLKDKTGSKLTGSGMSFLKVAERKKLASSTAEALSANAANRRRLFTAADADMEVHVGMLALGGTVLVLAAVLYKAQTKQQADLQI